MSNEPICSFLMAMEDDQLDVARARNVVVVVATRAGFKALMERCAAAIGILDAGPGEPEDLVDPTEGKDPNDLS